MKLSFIRCETCQDFYIKPENTNFVLSHPSDLYTLFPVSLSALTLLVYWLGSGGREHEGVASSWQQNTGPRLTSPKLMPLVTGKTRGERAKPTPCGTCIPYIN